MALVVPKVGELNDLEFRRVNLFAGLPIGLYQNNFSPNLNTVLGDLVEANYAGYARVNTAWTIPAALNGLNQAQIVGTPCIFLQGAGPSTAQVIYGYFVLRGSTLMWAERFPTPVPFNLAGVGCVVTPVMTYFSQFSG